MYTILGASGHIGGMIADSLLQSGKKVRVLTRSEIRVKHFAERGAEVMTGDLEDVSYLVKAFDGAEAVFAMIPPNMKSVNYRNYQKCVGGAIARALKESPVRYVTALSSVGAHLPERAGVVQGLADMEHTLNKLSGINVMFLRPTFFMENFLGQIGLIKQMGVMGTVVESDFSFPVVATKDIARIGFQHLLNLDFEGKRVHYVLGPRDITMKEAASILGSAIGNPELKYVQFTPDQVKGGMVRAGLSENAAGAMVEFMESINSGWIFNEIRRNPGNTTPATLEEFAQVFAQTYKS
jgi:uncharacterized protein YbjT (DUF2867 family)